MIITEIKKNKNAPGYAVIADGEFLFSLDGETVLKENLKKGTELSKEKAASLKFQSEYYRAREKALRLLDRRAHSKAEIIRKLQENYPKEVSEAVAERLEEVGIINDEEFARLYYRELSLVKKFGEKRISTELYRRGISRDIIDSLKEENSDEEQYLKIVEELKRRRVDLSDEKIKRRTVAKFIRNGYSYDDIKTAFAALNEEIDDE